MKLKDLLFRIALVTAFGSQLTLYVTFLMAYASPDKTVLVSINTFGEALFELVFLTFGFLFSSIMVGWMVVSTLKEWQAVRQQAKV